MLYDYQATVKRVIDGDTIEVAVDLGFSLSWDTAVRLYGINTPELSSSDPIQRAGAKVARDYLIDLIYGKQVMLHTVKPKDKYGRYLAVVLLDQKNINEDMVAKGLAKPWDGQGEKP